MSILNIDVNFSSSGGSHSASITEVVDKNICNIASNNVQVTVNKQGKSIFGSSLTTSNSQINQILQDFVIEEVTTSVSSGSRKKQYKLIDKASITLDSCIILVRGETASPINNPLLYEGIIYDSSELPVNVLDAFNDYNGIGSNTTSGSFIADNIIVIGKSYSAVEFQDGAIKFFAIYNQGQLKDSLITSNGQSYSLNSPTIDSVVEANVTKASRKFGYTSSELIEAVQSKGFSFSGLPSSFSSSLVLFNTSGTIRECLSAVASFFGFYWFVNGTNITFINASEATNYTISDPTLVTDERILEASFTEGGRTPSIVASFVGTENGERKNNSIEFDSGSSIIKQFSRIDISKFLGSGSATTSFMAPFYTLFLFGPDSSDDIFDKIVYYAKHKYAAFQNSSIVEKFYNVTPADQGQKKTLEDIVGDEKESISGKYKTTKLVLKNAEFYNLLDSNGIVLEKPSGSPLGKIVQTFYKYFEGVFISKGLSESATHTLQFASSELSFSEAIEGSTTISEVESLKDFHELLVFIDAPNTNPTVRELAEFASSTLGTQVESSFYYVATKQRSKSIGDDPNENEFKFLSEEVDSSYSKGNSDSWLALTSESGEKITALLNKSKALFLNIGKQKKTARVTATRIKKGVEGSNDELNYRPLSYIYHEVKTSASNKFKSQLRVYSGSFFDAKKLSNYFSESPEIDVDLNSSSVTYYDLEIPSKDITLDGISIQFSSDGISTTITRSNKSFLAADQSLILTAKQALISRNTNSSFKASTKNFFGLH